MAVEYPLPCPACGGSMPRKQEVRANGVEIDLYQCAEPSCARRVCIFFEPEGGASLEQRNFVESEVRRLGAFFPSDYTGSRRR